MDEMGSDPIVHSEHDYKTLEEKLFHSNSDYKALQDTFRKEHNDLILYHGRIAKLEKLLEQNEELIETLKNTIINQSIQLFGEKNGK